MINLPTVELVEKVWICGSKYSGVIIPEGKSKIEAAELDEVSSIKVKTPTVMQCSGALECVVDTTKKCGNHTLIIADVVLCRAHDKYWDNTNSKLSEIYKPLMQSTSNVFCTTEEAIAVDTQNIQSKLNKMFIVSR